MLPSKLFLLLNFLILLSCSLKTQCRKTKEILYIESWINTSGQYKFSSSSLTREDKTKPFLAVHAQKKRAIRYFKNGYVPYPFDEVLKDSFKQERRNAKRNIKRIYSSTDGLEKKDSHELLQAQEVGNVKRVQETETVDNMIPSQSELQTDIISEKIANNKNEVIGKLRLPITGTQLKPSGGYAKELLDLIRQSNEYINTVNTEIIKNKIESKVTGEDLSFFDDEQSLEEHEITYLNKIYDNNYVLNIYNLLRVWKKKNNIDLSVFVSKINSNTSMLPGERTVIKFSEIEKAQYLKKIKINRNVCVAMIFVDNKNRGANSENESDSDPSIMHNMFPVGILSHPLDISLLDKSGEISVLNLFRFRINNYNITETDFLVNAQLLTDINPKLNNLQLTLENKKIIINLYDKLLDLKMKYNHRIGNTSENEKLKHLEKITERIDEYVNVINVNKSINLKDSSLDFYTALYLEYFSFLALDIHANIQTKLQLMYTDNTELRLHNVKTYLSQLYDDFKIKLRGL